jgi:hypothetical protein
LSALGPNHFPTKQQCVKPGATTEVVLPRTTHKGDDDARRKVIYDHARSQRIQRAMRHTPALHRSKARFLYAGNQAAKSDHTRRRFQQALQGDVSYHLIPHPKPALAGRGLRDDRSSKRMD